MHSAGCLCYTTYFLPLCVFLYSSLFLLPAWMCLNRLFPSLFSPSLTPACRLRICPVFLCDKTPNPIKTKELCANPHSLTSYHTQLPQFKLLSSTYITVCSFCMKWESPGCHSQSFHIPRVYIFNNVAFVLFRQTMWCKICKEADSIVL